LDQSCIVRAGRPLLADGPVGDLPLFGYLATVCVLGASCLAPLCIQALRQRRSHPDGTMMLGGVSGISRQTSGTPSWQERSNGIGVDGGTVGHDVWLSWFVVFVTRSIWVDETVMADLIVAPQSWLQGKQVGSRRAPYQDLASTLSSIDALPRSIPQGNVCRVDGQPVALCHGPPAPCAAQPYRMVRGIRPKRCNEPRHRRHPSVEVLATRLQLREGSKVSITTPAGPVTVSVEGFFTIMRPTWENRG